MNAYHINKSVNYYKSLINVGNLIFLHPLSSFNLMNKKYVLLINHQRTEFMDKNYNKIIIIVKMLKFVSNLFELLNVCAIVFILV